MSLAIASTSMANPKTVEPHLTAESKIHLLKVVREAMQDGYATPEQYENSVRWINSTPCDSIERGLSAERKSQLEVAIAAQQRRAAVKVFGSFEADGWYVLFTNASDGDEPYMFYSQDPMGGIAPLTMWSGAATIFETEEVAKWVKQNANGIPNQLADCFAWYVTFSPN